MIYSYIKQYSFKFKLSMGNCIKGIVPVNNILVSLTQSVYFHGDLREVCEG